ncbi:MAG: twin-arginine translocase TatA/TatE family subunit [Pseudonocardiaceae bacterium]
MFDLSFEKLFILAVVALFVLGPERLPTAAAWLARTVRQIKNYTNDANQKIRDHLGPEFDELREPLNDLRSDLGGMRGWRDPRTALLRHLRDDPITPYRYPPPQGSWKELLDWEPTLNQQPARPLPLAVGERPPIDTDAT